MRLRLFVLLSLSGLLLAACGGMPRETDTLRRLTILHTNDEHGWMESYKGSGGADGLQRLWSQREGFGPDGPFLVISSGDMWTGPAISTTLAGESMVDVMNALGYRAATLGNHDFDFGQDAIRQRRLEASRALTARTCRIQKSWLATNSSATALPMSNPFTICMSSQWRSAWGAG